MVTNSNSTDTTWNADSNFVPVRVHGVVGTYPAFDKIGVVDTADASANDLRYFAPSSSGFPPTSNIVKGRIMNGVNHIVGGSYVSIVNVQNANTAPQEGTRIMFTPCKSVKIGDISTITLKLNSIKEIGNGLGPSEFSLDQNYPNPFNPATHLRFTIAHLRFVSLKIYDVLGREVVTLVHETMKPGTYSVEWNASRFASGVYFYQLRAGNFVSAKKMVLLK